jgi:hypothetical protein
MMNNYIKRSALLLGAAAMIGTSAMAEGQWRNINSKLQNPAFIPGWSGALTAVGEGVGETYNGAFDLYQVVTDAPAGEYTLTVNAFYRYATNDESKENMANGANHNAYIYINDAEAVVEGLFDKHADAAPNSLGEAVTYFAAGDYVNTVTYNHAGGDLKIGIKNLGGRSDEWTAFDNFKLVGPEGEVALANADFSEELNSDKNQTIWNCANIDGSNKGPDVNKAGGVYRKTNASPYNFGQKVALEAGTYRFGVQSFLRYGGGTTTTGGYWTVKGEHSYVEGESALDRHNNGSEAESDAAYVYVTNGTFINGEGVEEKPVSEEDIDEGDFYTQTAIKCMFDETFDSYPVNEPETTDDTTAEGYGWCDSGFEYQAAKLFVNNPNAYRNYVEFTLTEPASVWVGLKKDVNAPSQYWNPFRDFTLEVYEENDGIQNVAANLDANAPAVYYNLQGVRVANPSNGIFIVKQGNKVSKQVIR